MFKKIKEETIELPVLIAGYYGLRRSEVVGLKWSNKNGRNYCKTTSQINKEIITVCEQFASKMRAKKDFCEYFIKICKIFIQNQFFIKIE